MCGDGCIRNIYEVVPGTELINREYGDIVVYNNKKGMVIDVWENINLDMHVALRANEESIVCQSLFNYCIKTGKFKHEVTYELDISNRYYGRGHSLDEDMREAGL